MTGAAGQQRVPQSFIADYPITLAPIAEQAAIVRYLDYMDRRVRKYIRAKQRLITLLNEQKQAIIQRAVTRGLDPDVHLKPSGVPWLGDIPEHWRDLPNRALFDEANEREHADEEMLSVTIAQGVIQQKTYLQTSIKRDSSNMDKTAYKLVCPGDIVYNKMRAWQGAFGLSEYRGIVSPAYVVVRQRGSDSSRYFHHLFRTPCFAKEAERLSYGIVSDMWSLRPEDFKMIRSPVPPRSEQKAIAEYIDASTIRLDGAIDAAQHEIYLLREYRTRLVADVVTGKLDVREAAAALPDEPEEEQEPLDVGTELDEEEGEATGGDDEEQEA
jgi:type I restriction enzyme S subunit